MILYIASSNYPLDSYPAANPLTFTCHNLKGLVAFVQYTSCSYLINGVLTKMTEFLDNLENTPEDSRFAKEIEEVVISFINMFLSGRFSEAADELHLFPQKFSDFIIQENKCLSKEPLLNLYKIFLDNVCGELKRLLENREFDQVLKMCEFFSFRHQQRSPFCLDKVNEIYKFIQLQVFPPPANHLASDFENFERQCKILDILDKLRLKKRKDTFSFKFVEKLVEAGMHDQAQIHANGISSFQEQNKALRIIHSENYFTRSDLPCEKLLALLNSLNDTVHSYLIDGVEQKMFEFIERLEKSDDNKDLVNRVEELMVSFINAFISENIDDANKALILLAKPAHDNTFCLLTRDCLFALYKVFLNNIVKLVKCRLLALNLIQFSETPNMCKFLSYWPSKSVEIGNFIMSRLCVPNSSPLRLREGVVNTEYLEMLRLLNLNDLRQSLLSLCVKKFVAIRQLNTAAILANDMDESDKKTAALRKIADARRQA